MKKFFKNHKFKIILTIIGALIMPLNIKEEISRNTSTYEIILMCVFGLITYTLMGYLIDKLTNKEEE